jgi:hypothetical protein
MLSVGFLLNLIQAKRIDCIYGLTLSSPAVEPRYLPVKLVSAATRGITPELELLPNLTSPPDFLIINIYESVASGWSQRARARTEKKRFLIHIRRKIHEEVNCSDAGYNFMHIPCWVFDDYLLADT